MKKILKKVLKRLVELYIDKLSTPINLIIKEKRASDMLKTILSKGNGVRINGEIYISHPQMVTLGNNIHIGNNAFLFTDGGLIIGDNTHISRNVTICTSNHQYEGVCIPYDNRRDY